MYRFCHLIVSFFFLLSLSNFRINESFPTFYFRSVNNILHFPSFFFSSLLSFCCSIFVCLVFHLYNGECFHLIFFYFCFVNVFVYLLCVWYKRKKNIWISLFSGKLLKLNCFEDFWIEKKYNQNIMRWLLEWKIHNHHNDTIIIELTIYVMS